jgi:hypothetical protein
VLGIVVSNVYYAAGPCVALGVVVESCGFMVRVGWRKRASLNGTSGDSRRFMPPRVNSVAFSRYLSTLLFISQWYPRITRRIKPKLFFSDLSRATLAQMKRT